MVCVSKQLSNKIAAFSLLCALLIVTLHVDAHMPAGSLGNFIVCFVRGGASIAVPFFCIASGFFLSGKMGEVGWWKSAVIKRIQSLVVPFFIWNIVAWFFYFVLSKAAGLAGLSFGIDYVQSITWRKAISFMGLDPFSYPMHGYYWYVRMLFAFVLVSPAFLVCRRRIAGAVVLLLLFVGWVVFNRIKGDGSWSFFWEWTFPIRCLFFLCLGIWVRYNPICIKKFVGYISLIGGAVLLTVRGLGFTLVPDLMVLMTILLLVGLWVPFEWRVSPLVASCGFPIYTLHWFVVRVADIGVKAMGIEDAVRSKLILYLLCLTGVEMASFFCAYGMRRYIPKVSAFVFGR